MKSYFFLLFLSFTIAQDELLYVMQLSRNGATYPEYTELDWNVDPLELTSAGATQHYLLGRSLRQRYIEDRQFLSYAYNPEEIAIYAANNNRCTASATAQAFGIYPPGTAPEFSFDPIIATKSVPPNVHDYDAWIKELKQAPLEYSMSSIPVTTLFELSMDESCPAFEDISDANINETESYERHKPLYDELMKAYETPEDVSLDYMSLLRNALISGMYEGKYYKNEETTKELIEKTKDIQLADDYENYLNITHEQIRLSRVVSSGFLKRLKEALDDAIDGEGKKLEVYVGTEALLQAVLMDLFETLEPDSVPFASALLLELYKEENGHYVKITYNKKEAHIQDIDNFIDRLKTTIESKSTIEEFCRGTYKAPFYKEYVNKYWNKYGFLLIALGVLGFAVLIAVCINCCHKKSEEELRLTK